LIPLHKLASSAASSDDAHNVPLAALNPRRYDRFRSQLHLSIRERGFVIQPFKDDLRAICFDLDWTLSYYPLSTRQVLEESLIRTSFPVEQLGDLATAANRYNELWLELERSAESTDTLRIQIMTAILEERGIRDASSAIEVSQAYDDIRRESGVLAYPGVNDFLARLRSKYKLGLYTNGPSDMQREKIEALGFDRWFDVILIAGDNRIYKPDPRAFELLVEKLAVDAEHTLFVGDSYDADIVGAYNAGMQTAWIKRKADAKIDGVQPTVVISETVLLRKVLL